MATKKIVKTIVAKTKLSPKVSPTRPALTLKLSGPGVRNGRIPIHDLIKVCEEAQNAVTRQAEALEGRKTIHPGPTTMGIRSECTLELCSIGGGSTLLGFDLAKPQMVFQDQRTLGLEAINEVVSSIHSLGNGDKKKNHDPGVLRSIYGISGILSEQVTSLTWESRAGEGGKAVTAKITKKVRERVAVHLSKPSFKTMQIDGVLDMADFSRRDRKCRVDPAIGPSVVCLFGPEFESKVQSSLRSPVRVKGLAKLLADSERIEHLTMSAIEPLSSMSLGEGNFLHSPTIRELMDAQDVTPFSRSKSVEWFDSDEELESFVSAIYSAREKP